MHPLAIHVRGADIDLVILYCKPDRDIVGLSRFATVMCQGQSLPTRYRLQSRQCIRIHCCLVEVTVFSEDCRIPPPTQSRKSQVKCCHSKSQAGAEWRNRDAWVFAIMPASNGQKMIWPIRFRVVHSATFYQSPARPWGGRSPGRPAVQSLEIKGERNGTKDYRGSRNFQRELRKGCGKRGGRSRKDGSRLEVGASGALRNGTGRPENSPIPRHHKDLLRH